MPGSETRTVAPPPAPRETVKPDGAPTRATVWKAIPPRKLVNFGRHIACCIDRDGLQFATVAHLGRRQRFIDARKVYLSTTSTSPEQQRAFLRDSVVEYLGEFGGRFTTISLTVGGVETAFRSIRMPRLSRKELASAILFEARKCMPFPLENCEWDYRVVGETGKSDRRHYRVSVLAATKDRLMELLGLFDEAGSPVAFIHHTQDVVGRLLRRLPGFTEYTNYALINIEQNQTQIAYYHGSCLQFQNTCNLGSSFLSTGSGQTIFEFFRESLATEIQNSLDYYGGLFPTHETHELFLYGNLAYTDELIELLTDRFGLTFRRFPAEELRFDGKSDPAVEATIPVCLSALASAACDVKLATLLPGQRRQRRKARRINAIGAALVVALILALSILWLSERTEISQKKEVLFETTSQIEAFHNSSAYEIYRTARQQVAVDQSFLQKTKVTPSYLGLLLKEISLLTPRSARLTRLDYTAGRPKSNLQIEGLVSGSDVPPEIILAEFVESLSRSPLFESVVIDRHVRKRVGETIELEFQISARGLV